MGLDEDTGCGVRSVVIMKRKNTVLASLAVILVLTASVGSAMAYFTAYAEASGGYTIHLGDETRVEEEFDSWTKHVSIANAEESEPVYIRVKAFCGNEYELVYSDESGKWSPGQDGYYYYSEIVPAGGKTDVLDIRIDHVPADVTDADSFNVAVIYESTPVSYTPDGDSYPDWDASLQTKTAEGGADA